MKLPDWAPGAVLALGVLLMTINLWYMVYSTHCKEGFANEQIATLTGQVLGMAEKAEKENPPSDTEVVGMYRAILIYIQSDYAKGLKLVYDMNRRIYGRYDKVPDNFDPRKILNNYVNPITGI